MKDFFQSLCGKWAGNCRTWFSPDELSDESPVRGEFSRIYSDVTLRHVYQSTIKEKDRRGEEWIAWNAITQRVEVSWLDSFHMKDSIMYSTGEPLLENSQDRESQNPESLTGFVVLGSYDFAADQPAWGWKTRYELVAHDKLVIQAFNISPTNEEALGVQVDYQRC